MKRQSLLLLIFSVLFSVFFLLLIFFRIPFPLYPLLNYQDVLDLLTPLVLIPIYWLLFRDPSSEQSNQFEEIIFIVFCALWVMGHGMHLAANSINNLSENLARSQVLDITKSDIYSLAYFLDEHLSHYLWHIGVLGLSLILVIRSSRQSVEAEKIGWVAYFAGFLHGFTWFCIFLEGQTVLLGFPASILIALLLLWRSRKQITSQPLLAFFLVTSLVAVLFFIGWGIYWQGFPQFSDVGLI